MKWKPLIFLIFISILAILFRMLFVSEGFFGTDAYYHHAVVKQSLEKGYLSNDNDLEVCYEGVKGGHPVGYYSLHYYFAKIFGLGAAFYFIPLMLGILSIVTAFFLVKRLFNERTAYLTSFLMAVSLSFVSMSLPKTFRGDNLVYPLLILGLLLVWNSISSVPAASPALALSNRKWKIAALVGLVLGASSFLWNGYIIILLCADAALLSFMLYNYFFGKVEKWQVVSAVIMFVLQMALVLPIAFLLMSRSLKGFVFATEYLPLLNLALISTLIILYASQNQSLRRKVALLFGVSLALIITAFIFKEDVTMLLQGMGSLQRQTTDTVVELVTTDLYRVYLHFGPLILTSLIGFFFILKLSQQKAYFLGAMLPALYAAYSANRFLFFASFFVLSLSAVALEAFLNFRWKNKRVALIFVTAFLAVAIIQSVQALNFVTGQPISEQAISALKYFGDNTPERSCLISSSGGAVYYYADRYGYLPTLGGETGERAKKYAELMLS
ncbi:MAG: hypothetical protein AABX69_00680, partial [Nanoarchaeota archaeon]